MSWGWRVFGVAVLAACMIGFAYGFHALAVQFGW